MEDWQLILISLPSEDRCVVSAIDSADRCGGNRRLSQFGSRESAVSVAGVAPRAGYAWALAARARHTGEPKLPERDNDFSLPSRLTSIATGQLRGSHRLDRRARPQPLLGEHLQLEKAWPRPPMLLCTCLGQPGRGR